MSKIKTYEGFYHKSKSEEELKSEILDCFLELQDKGFEITYADNDRDIHIDIGNEKPFSGDEILDTLEFAISYIKSELGLSMFNFGVYSGANRIFIEYSKIKNMEFITAKKVFIVFKKKNKIK